MCGIAGSFLEYDGASAASVSRMLSLIRHRGPDDGGEWEGAQWRIGMRRLSILDIEHGRQPMCSLDGGWVIVFNGEIYNFRDLAGRLAARGVALRTRSDTEVLLELIAAEGVRHALEAVEGMFAFAAIDLR